MATSPGPDPTWMVATSELVLGSIRKRVPSSPLWTQTAVSSAAIPYATKAPPFSVPNPEIVALTVPAAGRVGVGVMSVGGVVAAALLCEGFPPQAVSRHANTITI